MPRRRSPFAFEYVLLGLLDRQPMHGYDIYKELTRPGGLGLLWRCKQARLYAVLDKLAAGGLLAGELIPGGSHPARKQYHITPAGRDAFQRWLATPAVHGWEMRQEFLTRLYFAHLQGKTMVRNLLAAQRITFQAQIDRLRTQQADLRPDQEFERTVLGFRTQQMQSYLTWLEDCLNQQAD